MSLKWAFFVGFWLGIILVGWALDVYERHVLASRERRRQR